MPNLFKKLKRILMVDDSEIDLKINSKIVTLHQLSEEVVTCISAEEGLTYLRSNLSNAHLLPDLILLDIQMPDMDGFGFLEEYQQLPVEFREYCTVIILSSTLDFGDIIRAEANQHVKKLLRKPLNAQELKDTIS